MSNTANTWSVYGTNSEGLTLDKLASFASLAEAAGLSARHKGSRIEHIGESFARGVYSKQRKALYRDAIEELLTVEFRPAVAQSNPAGRIAATLGAFDALRAANPSDDWSAALEEAERTALWHLLMIVNTEIEGALADIRLSLARSRKKNRISK